VWRQTRPSRRVTWVTPSMVTVGPKGFGLMVIVHTAMISSPRCARCRTSKRIARARPMSRRFIAKNCSRPRTVWIGSVKTTSSA